MIDFLKKYTTKTILLLGGIVFVFNACSSDDDASNEEETTAINKLDLTQYNGDSKGVMMQAFYWDVEPIGEWYTTVETKLADWSAAGINRIWLPAPGKGQSGSFSMGYDPSDYFDVGEFEQHGTIETRFGSRAELEGLINTAHQNNIEVIADIVLGHNSGGGQQDNPYRPGDTEVYSLFNEANGNASGKFNRSYEHFHPNSIHANDAEALFFEKTDLCHDQQYVKDWLWLRDDSVANFYKDVLGFDGWRFDYVKSFAPSVVTEWNKKVGGFSVGENFDGNANTLKDWVDASGSSAFDFACFYRLEEALDRDKDLSILAESKNMLRKIYPEKAVTFIANHDTEKEENLNNRISYANKMMAHAYILTHDGYPTLFYSDYENPLFKEQLKNLIVIRNSLASGNVKILKAVKNEYIMQREGTDGNPGLILYINIGTEIASHEVTTSWKNKTLIDYSNNIKDNPSTNLSGTTTLTAPPKSFSIWSIAQ
ncbi:alpha-amylase [Aquimarina intermedia]|uniref:Alpha-amylase n=1 Tax=Aquimarina intermedia TaxID=350814 RepID=A0A5S5BZ55_9FLAO|nr:alpha-amylase [Aquimarina intermedia]TYP72219.1 alpha-amylase [Aquimarina intermedia]